MMNIAFPAIAAGFALPPESVRWVIICYTGVYALTSFAGGAVADVVGHVRVFRVGVLLTAVSLLAGGLAPSFEWMLAARALQGIAGGLVYGTAPGIVSLAAGPERRGRALGLLNAGIALGLAIGPLPAGALVDTFGWRAVFHARVPVAAAVFLASLWVPAVPIVPGARRMVRVGHLLRDPVPVACALAFLANGAIFAIWLLVPFYLVERRGLGAAAAGAMFMLTPLGTSLAAPLAGRIADRIGAAAPLAAGLVLQTAGLAALTRAGGETSGVIVAAALFAAGLGLGLFQVPMMTLVMGAFPPALQGAAGGLTYLSRTLGLVCGVAALAALFAARRPVAGFDRAFGEAFMLATALVGVAALVALARFRHLRPSPDR
jgi:MFS family permease